MKLFLIFLIFLWVGQVSVASYRPGSRLILLHTAVAGCDEAMVGWILKQNPDLVNQAVYFESDYGTEPPTPLTDGMKRRGVGITALMEVLFHWDSKYLLTCGDRPYAVSLQIVDILLQAGARADIKAGDGDTVWDELTRIKNSGNPYAEDFVRGVEELLSKYNQTPPSALQ